MSIQIRVFLTWLLVFVILVALEKWFRQQEWKRTAKDFDAWAFSMLFALPLQVLWWIWS